MTPEETGELARARLGIEAEAFMPSALGRYLVEKADELIEVNTHALIQASPDDIKTNTECRNGIQIGALFKAWLSDAIEDGQIARSQIEEYDALS